MKTVQTRQRFVAWNNSILFHPRNATVAYATTRRSVTLIVLTALTPPSHRQPYQQKPTKNVDNSHMAAALTPQPSNETLPVNRVTGLVMRDLMSYTWPDDFGLPMEASHKEVSATGRPAKDSFLTRPAPRCPATKGRATRTLASEQRCCCGHTTRAQPSFVCIRLGPSWTPSLCAHLHIIVCKQTKQAR